MSTRATPEPRLTSHCARPEFTLRLRAEARPSDESDPGADMRLKRVLKVLGRVFGLKCVRLEPEATETIAEGTE